MTNIKLPSRDGKDEHTVWIEGSHLLDEVIERINEVTGWNLYRFLEAKMMKLDKDMSCQPAICHKMADFKDDTEIQIVLGNILTDVIHEMYKLSNGCYEQRKLEVEKEYEKHLNELTKEHNELVKDYNTMCKEYDEILEFLREFKDTNVTLNIEVDGKERIKQLQRENEKIAKSHRDVTRENRKIKTETTKMSEKLNEVIKENELLSSMTKNKPVESNVDVSQKSILFVTCNENLTNKLTNIFDNATIYSDEKQDVLLSGIDMIVFLTSTISHSMYYKVKNIADTWGIKYIHCDYTNILRICQTINEENQ